MLRYAITVRKPNRESGTDPFAGLVEQAKRLSANRADFLQIREKNLKAKELIGLTRRIITAVREASPQGRPVLRVLVNGRSDVALAAGAGGVHLPSGADQLDVEQVRRLFAGEREEAAVISVACHTLNAVERASGEGADLILFSPIFGKITSEWGELQGIGLEALAEACRAAGETPVLALGGVSPANVQACLDAGAKGVAGIRLFL